MLIVPISGKIGWKNPPIVTLTILLLNCLVFFLFQTNDDQARMEAETFYLESGLARIEVPHYEHYLADTGAVDGAVEAVSPEDTDAVFRRHFEMERDATFIRELMADRIVTPDEAVYEEWRGLRDEYERKRDRSIAFSHGLRPAFPRTISFFTSMFLHGGVGHLVGNMVFLWILGCMLEIGAGRLLFSVIYLVGGLLAAGAFCLIYPSSTVPLVGASGAIAGLMGAYTVLYGRKRVSIFYSLGFYFNTATIPALLLLPVWLANECYQLFFSGASHVAYVAHIGGLAGGAGLAVVGDRLLGSVDRDRFEAAAEDKIGPLMDQALEHMGNLEMAKAREQFEAILDISPDHPDALAHLFNIHKLNPESAAFHETTRQLLQLRLKSTDTHFQALELYRSYSKIARRPSLPIPLYLQVAGIMAADGDTKGAERIIIAIFKKKPQTPGLPSSLVKLAKAFREGGQPDRWKRYRGLVCKHFPDSIEAEIIKKSNAAG